MTPDHSLLRRDARSILQQPGKPSIYVVTAIFLTFGILIEVLQQNVLSVNISTAEAQRYLNYFNAGNLDALVDMYEDIVPPKTALAIYWVLELAVALIGVGYRVFLMNAYRKNSPALSNLLDGFTFLGQLILLLFLQTLFIFLWSLLFLVPGIIAFYRYRLALFILIDDPSKGALQCLRESKAIMKGRKGDLFKLDLSLCGWLLLCCLGYIGMIIGLYARPYMGLVYIGWYDSVLHSLRQTGPDMPEAITLS